MDSIPFKLKLSNYGGGLSLIESATVVATAFYWNRLVKQSAVLGFLCKKSYLVRAPRLMGVKSMEAL